MTPTLPPKTIEVRYIPMQYAGEKEYVRLSSQLPPEEYEEASHYRRLQDRLAFATGRVLVRNMLSFYTGKPKLSWRFTRNNYGKPAIEGSHGIPDLRFNISHTAGAVVAAVSLGREVGVDIESSVDARRNCMEIARSHFSHSEIDLLESFPSEHQPALFFKLWTLKEAYIKARGRSLSEGISTFSFALDPPTLSFPPQSSEDAALWYFSQHTLMPSHILAIAALRVDHQEQINTHLTEVALQELL